MRHQFASDNQAGICPEAWAALARANADHAPSYGEDDWTKRATELVRELFETDCDVHFTLTGTAANALAVAGLGNSYNAVLCHETAHVNTSECGAPEFFSGGMKLVTCPGDMGKIDPAAMERLASTKKDTHVPKPRVLSLTQATERGTVYTLAELADLTGRAKRHGLRVHVDGARFANAVVSLECSPADMTWRAGIDVLTLGGTKNGMAMAEAVVFFDRGMSADFDYRCRQAGQIASKMRFITAQWVGMLEGGAWRRHAVHANAMARRIESGLRQTPGVRVRFPAQANGVFAELSPALHAGLVQKGWSFFPFMGEHGVRLMCAWDTPPETVDRFLEDVRTFAV